MSKLFENYHSEEEVLPFMPAAGAINGLSEQEIIDKVKDVLRSPAEAAIWGSVTWNGGEGNEPLYGRVYYHNRLTGQTSNSIGLPNIGFEKAKDLQPRLQEYGDIVDKPVIPSFSPGKGEEALEVLPAMALGFVKGGADIIEVNYSCPNKIVEGGGREPVLGHDLDMMFEIDELIEREVGLDIIVIRKLPPYLAERQLLIPVVADGFARKRGKVILSIYNTIGNQQVLGEFGEPALGVPGNLGGLSGPATAEVGRQGTWAFREHLPEDIGLISCLGVTNGAEIHRRVDQYGADSTAGVTVLFENELSGLSYGETITKLAEEYAEAA